MRLRLEGRSLSLSPRKATWGRARVLPSPGEAPSTRGSSSDPLAAAVAAVSPWCPAPPRAGPPGFLLAPPRLPPRGARVATRAPDPKAGNPGTREGRAGARRGGDTVGPRGAGAPGRSRPPRRGPWGRGPGVLPAPALRSSRLALAAGVAGGGARPCPIPAHPAPSVGLRSASPRRVWRPHGQARVQGRRCPARPSPRPRPARGGRPERSFVTSGGRRAASRAGLTRRGAGAGPGRGAWSRGPAAGCPCGWSRSSTARCWSPRAAASAASPGSCWTAQKSERGRGREPGTPPDSPRDTSPLPLRWPKAGARSGAGRRCARALSVSPAPVSGCASAAASRGAKVVLKVVASFRAGDRAAGRGTAGDAGLEPGRGAWIPSPRASRRDAGLLTPHVCHN